MRYRSPRSHRCEEFPAEYSLASPPRRTRLRFLSLAHAATNNLVRRAKLSEWQPGTFSSVSLQGVTPSYQGTCREPTGKLLARAELLKPESIEPGTLADDLSWPERSPTAPAARPSSREGPDIICQSSSREAGGQLGCLRRYRAPGRHSGKPC